MLHKRLLSPGPVFNIYVVCQGDDSEVVDFINGLREPDYGQFSHLLDRLNNQGVPRNPSKFKNEGNDIYALKTKNARVYGFFDGKKTFVLAVGFMKHAAGGKKVERRACERAEEMRSKLKNGGIR